MCHASRSHAGAFESPCREPFVLRLERYVRLEAGHDERLHFALEQSWLQAAHENDTEIGAADIYGWGAALDGPRFRGRTVAIGPGYDDRNIEGRPGYTRERIDETRREELGKAFLATREKHLGDQPDDMTKSQLEQQAANAGIDGAGSMSKSELESKLEEEAEI